MTKYGKCVSKKEEKKRYKCRSAEAFKKIAGRVPSKSDKKKKKKREEKGGKEKQSSVTIQI